MQKTCKIFIAGHKGLVGSAFVRLLQAQGYSNLILRTHKELDLTDQKATAFFFEKEKPEYVFLAAAKVGGIHANSSYPAEFIYQNTQIQTNVLHQSYLHKVKRLLFLGSACIYPKVCPQPIKEEYLMTGPLEPTNDAYAIAKIAGIKMCGAYNKQYGTKFLAVMPANLFGPNDNDDLENSHVIPALIRKFKEAKARSAATVTVWGTGNATRDFLHVDDMAAACLELINLSDEKYLELIQDRAWPIINIGSGQETSIKQLAEMIREAVGYKGSIVWDTSKPDGTPRRVLGGMHNTNRMRAKSQGQMTLNQRLPLVEPK